MKTLMTVGTRDHMAMRHALERSWDRFTFRDIVVFTDNPLYFTDLPNVNIHNQDWRGVIVAAWHGYLGKDTAGRRRAMRKWAEAHPF